MEIKYTNKELDKREIYKHTRASATSLKDVNDGEKIAPVEVVIYEDVNSKGEVVTITSVVDANGKHYATNSRFFREELMYLLNLMDGEEFEIKVKKPVSKGGRTFVTCELA